MSESDRTKPPSAWLEQLADAGHWDRLIKIASDSLAIDPEDAETHRHIAWAYAKTDRLPELYRHVTFLLSADPDDARHHHLAAVYYLEAKLPKQAEPHIETLLRLEPQSATYHYLAGIHALRTGKIDKARRNLASARALAPEWPAAAHLAIQIDGMKQTAASDAWDRIHRLEEALGLDPQNAGMLTSIGEIYLRELERPRDAEDFFRRALTIDPTDHDLQARLLRALRTRSLLYRTLSIPGDVGAFFAKALREGRINWLLAILFIKGLATVFVWWVVVGALFMPSAKVYEWFVLAEIPRTRPFPRVFAWMNVVRAWPQGLRMLTCFTIVVGFWVGLLAAFGVHWSTTLEIIAWIFGVHFMVICILVGVRNVRARFGLWSHRRRLRKQAAQKFEALA